MIKPLLYSAAVTGLVIISISCNSVTGSGNIITENRTPGNFTSVDISGPFEVEIKKGPSSVRIEADDNLMKYIDTDVSGRTLEVDIDKNSITDGHLKLFITVPRLEMVKGSASASIKMNEIISGSDKMEFDASSSAEITADVDAPEVHAESSSAGTVNISGRTRVFNGSASSGSTLNAIKLLSEKSRVSTSSGASAQVFSSVNLEAEASSGSNIQYRGGGNVKKDESSGGSVQMIN